MADGLLLITTNDMHSHAEAYAALVTGVREYVASHGALPVIKADAGDWFSGTVYSSLAPNSNRAFPPVELDFFLANDVVFCLGNHEFDAQEAGLETMLAKAAARGLVLGVQSDLTEPAETRLASRRLFSSRLDERRVLNRALLQHVDGYGTVGFVGLMGPGARKGIAALDAWSFLSWSDALARARNLVAGLRAQGARLVIALLHGSGAEASELWGKTACDFVACGHTHERIVPTTQAPFVQAGCYARAFGATVIAAGGHVREACVVNVKAPPTEPHPALHAIVRPLFARAWGVDMDARVRLPAALRVPVVRSRGCPFASALLSLAVDELNRERASSTSSDARIIQGMFLPNELVRGDFALLPDGLCGFEDVVGAVEVGQSDPDRFGMDLVVIATRGWRVRVLDGLFSLATALYTPDAAPAYSHACLEAPLAATVRVVTTSFTLQTLRPIPAFVFPFEVVETIRVPLSILVWRALQRVPAACL